VKTHSARKKQGDTFADQMKLHDRITSVLRDPTTLRAISDAINADTDVERSAEGLTEQVELLVWRGLIVNTGEQFAFAGKFGSAT